MSNTDKVFSFDESSKEQILQDFDNYKAEYCTSTFLAQHPQASEYDLRDFLESAKRSYLRAKRNHMSDEL